MRTNPLIIACIALGISATAQTDTYREDSQVRGHFNLETDLGKNFTVHLDQQYRITNNMSDMTRASADIGITYKISKHIKLS